nr:hypothetical protein [Kibdelosporangium sp. MJ126-NF4]CTQ90255.1 hypothetical protein [Kibdelosporangium sp. MJ126-NF4]
MCPFPLSPGDVPATEGIVDRPPQRQVNPTAKPRKNQDPVTLSGARQSREVRRVCAGACGVRANAQGCGSWGVPPVWPGRSHTMACREVGLRKPTHSAGDTDLPARRGFLWQVIREGRPAPPLDPGNHVG